MSGVKKNPSPPKDDLQDDWAAVKRSPGGSPEEATPDLTKAVQAIAPDAKFKIVIDGFDHRITTKQHPTLAEAEQDALDMLNQIVRGQLESIGAGIRETGRKLEDLRQDHFRLEGSLPYLPPAPPQEPEEPELEEDDIPF